MRRSIHLWPESQCRHEDQVEVAAVLEGARGKRTKLSFRLPLEARPSLTPSADPFVLASLFAVLRSGSDLEVHGAVSPSLLAGLEEFQAVWCRWRPNRYRPFSVIADVEREEPCEESGRTVMAFSGGLDSCCTAWRHTRGSVGRRSRGVDAAVMVHGFDIPLDQTDVFPRAVVRSRAVLESIDVPLIAMACNVRVLRDDWEDSHGAALAACLHLLAGGYATGLIASSHAYQALRFPWGSTPLTDPMLGSASFRIVHDGCDLTRWEKADAIGDWDAALRHFRVCWEGEHLDRNCGSCVSCVATALCFAVVGRSIPPGMPISSPEEAVDRLRALKLSTVQIVHFENKALAARRNGITEPWVTSLAQVTRGHRRAGSKRRFGRGIALCRRLWRRRKRRHQTQSPGERGI